MKNSSISRFYDGQSVFITGGTGFMGKVLVEKLLRSCSGIDRLFLLLRSSPAKDANCRLEELVNNEVFDSLRKTKPEVFSKLIPVSGDISLTDLGLSFSDEQMVISSASIVFHTAARIKFDDDLRSAIESNVKGPQNVIRFCGKIKKLKVFVHVSTAFNNLDKAEIEEVIYPASLNPQKLIEFVDTMDGQLLASITKQLVGKCPNVYAFTKALGEQLLESECQENNIPLVVVRPSIVTASLHEPLPGWIDNLNGPSGIIAGVGKGLIRITKTDTKLIGDLIPVDIAINLMIAAAWDTAVCKLNKGNETRVYNCATGFHNPLTWSLFNTYGMAAWKKYPTREMAWYPSLSFRSGSLQYQMDISLYHYLPAYFIDFFARILRRNPFMVRLYKKIHRASSCLDFYVVREWKFVSENSIHLLKKMSTDDRRVFYFDVREIDWESYITNYILGCRKFLLKDDLSSLPIARRNLKRLYWLKIFIRTISLFALGATFYLFFLFSNQFA